MGSETVGGVETMMDLRARERNERRHYLKRANRDEWEEQLRRGWTGSDDSSNSTGHIFGCRIGITSHEFSSLPADLLDLLYRIGRAEDLPDRYRRWADQDHRERLLVYMDLAFSRRWFLRWCARGRCHARYAGLRLGGAIAFTKAARMRVAARDDKWSGIDTRMLSNGRRAMDERPPAPRRPPGTNVRDGRFP